VAAAHGLVDAHQRFRRHIVKLVTSAVVRGSRQGESHGGVYLIDLEAQSACLALDWNTPDIEWHGRGGDRGLRGIAVDGDRLYVAASDRLLAFSPDFKPIDSYPSPLLKQCHEIAVWERTLYLTSAGYDSILGFDLDEHRFHWALHVQSSNFRFKGTVFDPMADDGPLPLNKLQINSVFCNRHGMYITGLKTGGMLHFNGKDINMAVQLPAGAYNAQPFRDGVVFNDSEANVLRYTGRGEGEEDRAMAVPTLDTALMTHSEAITDGIARPGFARGLCVLSDRIVAGGSSPATIAVYDFAANECLGSVSLSHDVRNTIHSIAQWPFSSENGDGPFGPVPVNRHGTGPMGQSR
jgi:hypothetical protein